MLVAGLPLADSNFGRALGLRQAGEWGNVEELLKLVAEQLDASNRLFIMANTKKGTPPPKPIKIERPPARRPKGAPKPAARRQATSEEMAQFFAGRARYKGGPAVSPSPN